MKTRSILLCGIATLLLLSSFQAQAYHEIAGGPIVVNGEEIDSAQGYQLMQFYGPVAAGDYWYDPASGLWGISGGPSTGQIHPQLPLGGALRADASGGGSRVFINGRELHRAEVAYLRQLYGTVVPGRYWMNAQLVGGFEGGPAIFDLRAAGGGGRPVSGAGYNRNTVGGGLMSDGNCSGYLHPGGHTVMSGNC